jgi:Holliday junction resolvase-like predicted endonuclease
MSSFTVGREAENIACEYLKSLKYIIIDKNWRTKYCEIDIIAKKNKCMYFTEVKYRRSNLQGRGLDYITPKKLKQMSYSAEIWLHNNNWQYDSELCAIELTGSPPTVTNLIVGI